MYNFKVQKSVEKLRLRICRKRKKMGFRYIMKKIMPIMAGVGMAFLADASAMAEELNMSLVIEGTAKGADTSVIQDMDYTTSIEFMKGDVITINAVDSQKIDSVYIIWDSPAQPWTLKADGNSISCGQNGFIHEYVKLDTQAETVQIVIPADNVYISDVRIFSEGELPGDVQVWNPPCENADIMLISSHADDELLFLGGIIPVYTHLYDADIQVVYMTEFWSKEKIREHEKLNGLWATGLDIYPVCGNFYDEYSEDIETARSQYNEEELTGYITEVIREFEPQIVVTHDFNGEYGHGFHCLVTEKTVEAVNNAMNEEFFPESAKEYGLWDTPKTYIHIYKENALKLDLSVTIEKMQGKTALQLVKDGYEQHVSQHKWVRFFVSDDYEYSCADFGLYRTTVGYDTGNDMLENLKTYKVQAKEEQQRLERESREQESREQESLEQASREQERLEQESRERESLEEASRQAESESVRIAKEEMERDRATTIIIVAAAVVLVVVGFIVYRVKKKA